MVGGHGGRLPFRCLRDTPSGEAEVKFSEHLCSLAEGLSEGRGVEK